MKTSYESMLRESEKICDREKDIMDTLRTVEEKHEGERS
jgi:hypothetical protein